MIYMQKQYSQKIPSAGRSRRNIKLEERSESITNITHTSQRNHRHLKHPEVKHLNLDYFKSMPCGMPSTHNHKNCVFYHNTKDRRRPGNFYSGQLCRFMEENKKCPNGDQCLNAHSRVEQLYRADTYKTKFCSHYPNNVEGCEYKQFCSFAHEEGEIIIDLIHNLEYDDDFYMFSYKTVFCPFNLTEHDKALCVYAHNWQDFRRKPSLYKYDPISCPDWELKGFVSDYSVEGCPRSFGCQMCHGWKESQYHFLSYRTKKCLTSGCKKGECHHFHSQKEQRVVDDLVQNNIFKIMPRYRIVEGTFKHDFNTGFKAKARIEEEPAVHKDKTVVLLKNPTIIQEKIRAKTTIDLNSASVTANDQIQSKWIAQADVYESEDQGCGDNDQSSNEVHKLINWIGQIDSEKS